MKTAGTVNWRSFLFVPGTRPDRFEKALASGADAVCVDLEDAVTGEGKDQARGSAGAFLAASGGADRVVRINSVRGLAGVRDLLAVIEARPAAGWIAVPKVESAEEVRWIDAILTEAGSGLGLVVQVETPRGIERAPEIAEASPRASALMFGGFDLAAELGTAASWDALLYGRSRAVHAAAQAGLLAIDTPFADVRDPEGCGLEARRAGALGFAAKMAIHPSQVPPINAAYTPTPEEVERARRVVAALAEARGGVVLLDGRMIEKPIVASMERVLARARAAGLPLGPA